jgi:hypothetical protein
MRKNLETLAVIHLGNYSEEMDGCREVINDNCPCCKWEPSPYKETTDSGEFDSRKEVVGEIWNPNFEKYEGNIYQIFHCQNCGILYATHLN